MTDKQQLQSNGLRDILTVLFKHKKKIFIVFAGITVITAIAAISSPAYFETRSVIMVKPGREYTPVGEPLQEMRLPVVSQESMVNSEIQIIRSNDLLGTVVATMGVENLYPGLQKTSKKGARLLEAAIYQFNEDLKVKDVKGSNVIEIYFQHRSPQIAQKAANMLVLKLRDKHLQVYGTAKSSFIEDQLKAYREKVVEAGATLAKYKEESNIISLKDQYFWLVGKHTDLESMLRIEESKLRELQNKISFLKNQKRKVVSDLYTDTTRSRLTELKRRETELLATYKENSRAVTNIRDEIRTVQEALGKYEEDRKETAEWTILEAELAPQQIKINNLRKQVVDLDAQLQTLSMSDKEYTKLERDLDMQQKNFESYQKKLEEMKIAEDLDRRKITNLGVIEEATLPVKPIKGNVRKVIGLGLFLAIAGSVGAAYAAEYVPQCMTTPQSAQRYLRLPVLVSISQKV